MEGTELKDAKKKKVVKKSKTTKKSNNDEIVEADFKLDKYSIVLICIFVAQIVFCIAMVTWTGNRIHQGERELIREQATYYTWLLNFHKQVEAQDKAFKNDFDDEKTPA